MLLSAIKRFQFKRPIVDNLAYLTFYIIPGLSAISYQHIALIPNLNDFTADICA